MLSARLIRRIKSIDWDFTGNYSESRFSAFHFHPGRFASQLPASLIGLLTKPGDTVLDPFAGSGTTLIEAQRLGRKSIGIDLNPVSCVVARAKTLAMPAHRVEREIAAITDDAVTYLTSRPSLRVRRGIRPRIPETVQVDKWYGAAVSRDLGLLWRMILHYRGVRRALATAALSAILLRVCREGRHWGFVCDNTTPVGNSKQRDVLLEFRRVLDTILRAYHDRDAEWAAAGEKQGSIAPARVVCGDAVHEMDQLSPSSVNLVITSPPYWGVTDYIKAQRLSMEWLGWEIEPLRQKEIGARSKRHRRSSKEEYLRGLAASFRSIERILKSGGFFAIMAGESPWRAPVVGSVESLLQSTGLRMEVNLNRKVSSQRRLTPSITGEHLFILSK